MNIITLKQADTIIDAIFARSRELNLRPMTAVVVEPGNVVKAFKKEDHASALRLEMSLGKTYAALALGRSRTRRRHFTAGGEKQHLCLGFLYQNGMQIFMTVGEELAQGVGGKGDAEEVVDGGGGEVQVGHDHPFSRQRQARAQVGRQKGLSRPPLAAAQRDDGL